MRRGHKKKRKASVLCAKQTETRDCISGKSGGSRGRKCVLLGVIFLIAAAMYFLVPADSLPTFLPGHETGLMRIRAKHGMLSGAIGVVLLGVSWFLGRR